MSDPALAVVLESSPGVPGQANNNPASAAPQGVSTQFDPSTLAYGTQLPKRLQSPEVFAKLTTPGTKLEHLVDGFLQAQEKLTQFDGKVVVPGENADPKEWDSVWKALGKPEKSDEYKFDRSGDLEKLPVIPGLDEATAEMYFKHNIPKPVAEAIWKEQATRTVTLMNEIRARAEAEKAQGLKDLEILWGRDFAEKRTRLENFASSFFGADDWKVFTQTPLANKAGFLDKLLSLEKATSNATTHTGGPAGSGPKSLAERIFGDS